MKYLVLLLALVAAPAFAQSTSGSSSSSRSAVSASQGNAQTLIVQSAAIPAATSATENVHYSGADRSAPTNVAGGFAAGFAPDNCSNTAQIGGSGPGFSINAGKAVPESNCQAMRRVDARIRVASGYAVLGHPELAKYQLDQASIDICIADGYDPASCRNNH